MLTWYGFWASAWGQTEPQPTCAGNGPGRVCFDLQGKAHPPVPNSGAMRIGEHWSWSRKARSFFHDGQPVLLSGAAEDLVASYPSSFEEKQGQLHVQLGPEIVEYDPSGRVLQRWRIL